MSEKPMTELLRKAGIIDKHIAEFEKWRLIDPEESEKQAEHMVEDLVHDIAELLDSEPVMKQTLVAPVHAREPPKLWYGGEESFHAVRDEMGRLLVNDRASVIRGDTVWCEDSPNQNYTVLEIEDLYEDSKVVARMLTVEKE